MKRLCTIQDTLIDMVEYQLLNPQAVCTKELGEAVDMIKDLEETIYYCTIVKAMHNPSESETVQDWTKMGHSPRTRESYLNLKDGNHSKEDAIKELEKYIQELSNDILDMIKEASPEEKQLLQKKIAILATKINV